MRHFNTAGPCNPADHYMLPALERLPDVGGLVEQKSYFVLHAPPADGKDHGAARSGGAARRNGAPRGTVRLLRGGAGLRR